MPDSTYVTSRTIGAIAVATVVREKFTDHEAEIIRNEAAAAAEAARWKLALDMSNVTFLTSAGIGTLVSLHKSCAAGKGKLAVFGLSPQLLELLKLTKLDKLFLIRADEAAAVVAVA
jgi:anti-sigma B factor antagonist